MRENEGRKTEGRGKKELTEKEEEESSKRQRAREVGEKE